MSSTDKRPQGALGPRILEGIHFHMLGHAAVLAVNFLLTPIIVRGLGIAGYGLYTLMWTISGYIMLLNVGTTTGAQRYTAQWFHKAETTPLSALLFKVFWLQMGLAVLGGAMLWAGRGWLTHSWLNTDGAILDMAPWVFGCVALSAPAGFALHYGINLIYGMQRFGAYNLFVTLQSITVAIVSVGLLAFGGGLKEIAVTFLAAHAVLAALALFQVRGLLRLPSRAKPGAAKEFFVFSGRSWMSQILWLVIFQGDRLFIGTMLPLTMMGYYAISSTLAQKFNTFCGAVTSAALPMISELYGRGETVRLRRFYLKATELSFCFILPLSVLSFVLIPQFMTLWLGEDFSRVSTWPFRMLVLGNLGYLAAFLPNCVVQSHGSPQVRTTSQAAKVVVALILWPILIPRYGILGAAMGFMAAEWLVAPMYIHYVHKKFLKIPLRTYWNESCWRPAVAGMALAALMVATHGRVSGWIDLILLGGGGGGLFCGVTYWLLDDEAKNLLSDWIKTKLKRDAAKP